LPACHVGDARYTDRDLRPLQMKPSRYELFDSALNVMIKKHLPRISPARKEEVHAQCWIAVLTAMKKWEKDRGEVNGWVYSSVLYTLRDIKKEMIHKGKGQTFTRIDQSLECEAD
jgi:hypothetical protein